MSNIDELDINPFFKALQTTFCQAYDRAQAECYMICVPQSDCLQRVIITEKFVDTHILKPSPFFQSQYTTLQSEKQVVVLDDYGDFITTEEGFPTKAKIKILSQELGYNKEYKPYKIVVLSRPLDINILKYTTVENGASSSETVNLDYTFNGCKEFLHQSTDFEKAIGDLEVELHKFNSSYILLKDYLHDAADRLQELTISTAETCIKNAKTKKLKSATLSLKDMLMAAVETYVIGSVYRKLYPVICEKCQSDDVYMARKCNLLQGLSSRHLHVPQHFCIPVTSAADKLRRMDTLLTPVEKLYCLKSTIDKLTEEVNVHVQTIQTPGLPLEDLPCLTSDDLIPILVTVLVEANNSHIHSDIFYIDNFYWLATNNDTDTLSYCLVTFKAAISYLMTTNFDDVNLTSVAQTRTSPKPQTREPDKALRTPNQEPTSSRISKNRGYQSPKSRLDEQLKTIDKMLKDTTVEAETSKKKSEKPVSSIFGGSTSPLPVKTEVLIDKEEDKDMGDFLSSLQNDGFLSFGKQT